MRERTSGIASGPWGQRRQNNASLPDRTTEYFIMNTLIWLLIGVGVFTLLLGIGFVLPMVYANLGLGSPGQ